MKNIMKNNMKYSINIMKNNMKYSINISGSGDIDDLLTSLKTVVQDIEKIKDNNPDYLDGFGYEDHIVMVSLNEIENE